MTETQGELLKESVTKTLVALYANGFRYPLHIIVCSSTGAIWSFDLHRGGRTSNESTLGGDLTAFPIVFEFFDVSGKHHTLTLVDDCMDHWEQSLKKTGGTIQ